mmetsp:Transcript_23842/g.23606  ORF Transcript_23842/g.23606 Transcript_23842/m.23606 type:complete len:92 (+) Transcript_23842:142-417(+)
MTQSSKAEISLGTSKILGPSQDIGILMGSFLHDYSCDIDNDGYFKCDCNKEYPEITFQLDGHNFKIKQNEYFWVFNNSCYPSFGHSTKEDT